MSAPKLFTRGFLFLTIGAVFALILLLLLGTWQLHRLQWKEELISRVERQTKAEPVSYEAISTLAPSLRGTPQDLEYRPVTVTGTFDHGIEFFYYATFKGKPGYHIYSPLKVSGHVERPFLFINRGFVPLDYKDPATRKASLTKGDVTITGLMRWPDLEKPNSFTPDNDLDKRLFFWRDLAGMVDLAGLKPESVAPFFVYEEDRGAGAIPIGGVSIINFPNRHLGYALTWFGLALTLVAVYGALLIGRLRRSVQSASGRLE